MQPLNDLKSTKTRFGRKGWWIAIIALVCACALCVGLVTLFLSLVPKSQSVPSVPLAQECSSTDSPPANGKIVFTSERDGHEEIYMMNADGSAQTRLTKKNLSTNRPTWSPDGRKILFYSHTDPNVPTQDDLFVAYELFEMNADGSGQVKVTDPAELRIDGYPSPDGKLLVSSDGTNIFVANADGSGRKQLTSENNNSSPNWSPDGSMIAYVSSNGGSEAPMFTYLYLIRPDGTGMTKLMDSVFSYPSWSPDGKRIAIIANGYGLGREGYIYVINANGSGAIRISNKGGMNSPTWSPDGLWLAFDTPGVTDSFADIAVTKSTCAGFWRLTNSPGNDVGPQWQPRK